VTTKQNISDALCVSADFYLEEEGAEGTAMDENLGVSVVFDEDEEEVLSPFLS